MRTPLRALLAALLALPAAAALVAALALQDAPLVAPARDIAPADVERALAFARAHDPRQARPGQLRLAFVDERDAELLANHALQRWGGGSMRLRLLPGSARLQASVEWPQSPLGRWASWLNFELELRHGQRLPEVDAARIGRLPLPPGLVLPLLERLARSRGVPSEALAVADFVRGVRFERARATLVYAYPADARERVLGALLPAPQRERVRVYAERLAALGEPAPAQGSISLATLLPPLFRLASERSAAGADARDENRAAIVALVLYTNRRALDAVMPTALDGLPARPLRVTLQQREDFPRHFLISAAIAADAGSPLADAVGLWKELDDARRGSGFSFNDLAADRAGTRFGELAVREPARLQARLAAGVSEPDFMPAVADLPEFLPLAEFTARFGGVGAPAYERLMADVEARIAALALVR